METEGPPEDEHEAASEAAEALRRWRFEQLAALGFSNHRRAATRGRMK